MTRLRRTLNEAAKTIADAESQGLALIIDGRNVIDFYLYSPDEFLRVLKSSRYSTARLNEAAAAALIGTITLTPHTKTKSGPCRNAYQVQGPAASGAFGPLMYDIAMSWAAQRRGSSITSDRVAGHPATSRSAQRVWRHYATAGAGTNGRVIALKFDDISDPQTPPLIDDCELSVDEPALNSAYTTESPLDVTMLMQNHDACKTHVKKIFEQHAEELGTRSIYNPHAVANAFINSSSDFFDAQYKAKNVKTEAHAKRRLIEDEGGGFDYASGMGEMPYGMHFGSPGQLYNTFVKPFVDVGKTAAGKTAELSARAQAAAKVGFEALATSVVPILSSDYGKIFANEKQKIDAIKQRYADVYSSNWSALGGNDVMVASLMFAPWAFLTAALVNRSPGAALALVQVLGGGNQGIERFVSQAQAVYGDTKGKTNAGAQFWNKREEARMDTMSFEGLVFVGYVLAEDADASDGKKKRPPLSDLLTSDRLRKALQGSPVVQRMQRDGQQIVGATLHTVLTRAQGIAKAKTVDDIERAIGKQVPQLAQLKKLPPGEREQAATEVLKRVKTAALKFYADGLKKQAETAISAGVGRNNPYVRAYVKTIKSIDALGDGA